MKIVLAPPLPVCCYAVMLVVFPVSLVYQMLGKSNICPQFWHLKLQHFCIGPCGKICGRTYIFLLKVLAITDAAEGTHDVHTLAQVASEEHARLTADLNRVITFCRQY